MRRGKFDEPTPQERAFALARVRGASWVQAFEAAYPAKDGGSRSPHAVAVEAGKVAHRPVVERESSG